MNAASRYSTPPLSLLRSIRVMYTLNGNKYAIQPEYYNAAHACTTTP